MRNIYLRLKERKMIIKTWIWQIKVWGYNKAILAAVKDRPLTVFSHIWIHPRSICCVASRYLSHRYVVSDTVSFSFTHHTWQFIIFYHRLHLLLLVQSFILNLRLGSSANPFLQRPFLLLLDWFHGLADHFMFYSAQRLDLFAWCVRLSRS